MKFAGTISAKLFAMACAVILVCAISSAAAATESSTAKKPATTTHSSHKGKKSKKNASWRRRGQQKIDKQRTTQIQQALIREHYLEGSPSGVWDQKTQSALQHYQADNGWQSKTTPDSRALIKLGLGPDQQHLLNPESAMTTVPLAAGPEYKTASQPEGSASEDVPKIPNNLRK